MIVIRVLLYITIIIIEISVFIFNVLYDLRGGMTCNDLVDMQYHSSNSLMWHKSIRENLYIVALSSVAMVTYNAYWDRLVGEFLNDKS